MPNDKMLSEELDKILVKYSLVMPQTGERAKAIAEILSVLSSLLDIKVDADNKAVQGGRKS